MESPYKGEDNAPTQHLIPPSKTSVKWIVYYRVVGQRVPERDLTTTTKHHMPPQPNGDALLRHHLRLRDLST